MPHDVFISHSVKDKTIADALCATLESEGIRCWIAPRDVTPGMEWSGAIIGAIKQARVMVLVFTANANASPQIRREVERAVNHDVVILPFRVENVIPDESLEYFIGNVHWLDAMTPPIEAHFRNLARTIKILLAPVWTRDRPVAAMPTEEAVDAGPAPMPGGANAPFAERPVVPPSAEARSRQENRAHRAAVEVPVRVEEPVAGSGVLAPAAAAPLTPTRGAGSAARTGLALGRGVSRILIVVAYTTLIASIILTFLDILSSYVPGLYIAVPFVIILPAMILSFIVVQAHGRTRRKTGNTR
jgi:hypothetical protein